MYAADIYCLQRCKISSDNRWVRLTETAGQQELSLGITELPSLHDLRSTRDAGLMDNVRSYDRIRLQRHRLIHASACFFSVVETSFRSGDKYANGILFYGGLTFPTQKVFPELKILTK